MSNANQIDVESVIKAQSALVYRLAMAQTGNKFDADEVYQEVFLRYVRKKPSFNSDEHCRAWFIRVTVNCTKKLLAKSRNLVPISEELPFEDKERISLWHELQKLPPKYRRVIHLFYYEDMTTEQIASALGVSGGTVRSQLSRAREMLRSFMKEEDYV